MFDKTFDLRTLNGNNGFVVSGLGPGMQLGWSMSMVEDVNNDGIADFVVGAPSIASNGQGAGYVIFGRADGFPTNFDLRTLNGTNGFTVMGLNKGDFLGNSVATIGDINCDGRIDMVFGACNYNNLRGAAYVIFGQKNFLSIFDLKTLNGNNGFAVQGINPLDQIGIVTSPAGDINNDGRDDLVLSGYCAHNGLCKERGIVYVIFGQSTKFSPIFDVKTLNGTNGFSVLGVSEGDHLGISASTVGDINNDKKNDLGLGATGVNVGSGAGYIILGQETEFPSVIDLRMLNGTNGFTLSGLHAKDFLGTRIVSMGDINGDEKNDFAISAMGANGTKGVVYVIFGRHDEFPAIFDLKTLNGTNGFTISGLEVNEGLGYSVNRLGDINGDGKNDVAFGAPSLDVHTCAAQGISYIIFGQKSFPANFDLKNLDGNNGFIVPALSAKSCLGAFIAGGGDINHDGIADMVLGAPGVNNTQGASYIIFGKNPLRLINNQLVITQNQSLILDGGNLKAIDLNRDASQNSLIFNIDFVSGGRFEFFNKSVTSFLQQNIIDGQIRFVQDASKSISYTVSVSNSFVNTPPMVANATLKFAPPLLVNNKISIKQGKTTILNNENLSATDLNFPVGTLIFSVSHVEGGQFERLNKPGVSITVFTQQEVIDKQIQFAQDDSIGAGYKVVVTDGNNLSSIPSEANVTFAARPILEKPQLFIKQGGSVILNKTHINATDDTTPDSRLMITATNVKHGQFEYNDQPDIAINHFTQENITKSAVRFKTDGGYEKPSYKLTVKDDDDLIDGPHAANITFHDKPRLVNNGLTVRDGHTVTLVRSDLSATEMYTSEEKLEFEISNIEHGEFRWKNHTKISNSTLGITKFFQKNITDQQVQFAHDGSGIKPSYAVRVSDGELTSGDPQNATIEFNDNSEVDNTLKIGLGIAGGILLATSIGAIGFFGYKKYKRIEQEEQALISSAANNPNKQEQQARKAQIEDKKSSWNCQLF